MGKGWERRGLNSGFLEAGICITERRFGFGHDMESYIYELGDDAKKRLAHGRHGIAGLLEGRSMRAARSREVPSTSWSVTP